MISSMSMKPVRFGNLGSSQPKPWHKLDPYGRMLMEQGQLKGKIEILIRLDQSKQQSQPETLKKLEETGLKLHFSTGQVVGGISVSSGTIDADKLKALHDLDFVKQIDVSRPMFAEEP